MTLRSLKSTYQTQEKQQDDIRNVSTTGQQQHRSHFGSRFTSCTLYRLLPLPASLCHAIAISVSEIDFKRSISAVTEQTYKKPVHKTLKGHFMISKHYRLNFSCCFSRVLTSRQTHARNLDPIWLQCHWANFKKNSKSFMATFSPCCQSTNQIKFTMFLSTQCYPRRILLS